eukprot:Hpha_TRINITY_DN26406_c0_g1::TRINITY_DN26406_c0_g1_i1::g.34077::m.34077
MERISEVVGHTRAPFERADLSVVISMMRNTPPSELIVCEKHPLLERLVATLNDSCDDSAKSSALRVLALLSRSPENVAPLAVALEQVGQNFEKFVAACGDPLGGKSEFSSDVYRDLLTVLMGVSGYTLKGCQVLELCDHQMLTTVAALSSVLRGPYGLEPMELMIRGDRDVWESEVRVMVCATKVLADLTFCDTYFQSSDDREYHSSEMAKLDREFRANLSRVTKALLAVPVIDTITVQLDDWFSAVQKAFGRADRFLRMCGHSAATIPPASDPSTRLFSYLESAIGHTLTTVCNLLSYTTESDECVGKLRKHLSTQTILVQNLVLPYVGFLIDNLEMELAPADGGKPEERLQNFARQVLHISRVLSYVTFKIKVFRPWFRKQNFSSRLLKLKILMESNLKIELLAVLARLNVNIDSLDHEELGCAVVQSLLDIHSELPPAEKSRLARRLRNAADGFQPVDRTSSTFRALGALWKDPGSEAEDADREEPGQHRFQFQFGGATRSRGIGWGMTRGSGGGRGRGRGGSRWGRQLRGRAAVEKRWRWLRQGKSRRGRCKRVLRKYGGGAGWGRGGGGGDGAGSHDDRDTDEDEEEGEGSGDAKEEE